MSGINLLPWREMQRQARQRRVLAFAITSWVISAGLVFGAYLLLNDMQNFQQQRNNYLQAEISKIEKQLKEINEIRKKKAAMIARMEVIQELQRTRTQIVHLFDDFVRQLPEGVYLTRFQKRGKGMDLRGVAQSNARVSSLMRNLDSSEYFAGSNLNVINVAPQAGTRVSRFNVRVKEKPKPKPEAAQ